MHGRKLACMTGVHVFNCFHYNNLCGIETTSLFRLAASHQIPTGENIIAMSTLCFFESIKFKMVTFMQ